MIKCPECFHHFEPPVDVDTFDVREIQAFINESDYGWYELHEEGNEVAIKGLGLVANVHSHGGGEGSGEEMWCVIRVGSRLFRKDGYYRSWDGDNWDGKFYEVQPKPKTITVYEAA